MLYSCPWSESKASPPDPWGETHDVSEIMPLSLSHTVLPVGPSAHFGHPSGFSLSLLASSPFPRPAGFAPT